ncbi:S24 family peptidase [Blautia sp. HCP3S3_H10_1]|uniref:S24 family peptidase n=1 Tax=unclassified Blautia TaxID=2648079 RepID=UPI003F8E7C8A
MEPLYLDGQIIWIHKQETLEEGEIGVFFLDGDAYVKKYHQSDSGIQLISLNKKSLTVKVVVSKIFIFCSCRSSDIVLYLT